MAQSLCHIEKEVVNIACVPTRILSVRARASRPSKSSGAGSRGSHCPPLCYIVPGNPGKATFYSSYMRHLWRVSGGSVDIVCVTHAGQDPGMFKSDLKLKQSDAGANDADQANGSLRVENEQLYFTVSDQVEHHANALRQLSKPNQPIVLLGHSMGSYLILKMCRTADIEQRVVRILHLLPCPAWMGSSPNGQRLTPFLTTLLPWVPSIHWMATFLPHCLIRAAVRLHLYNVEKDFLEECVDIVMHTMVGENCAAAVAVTAALGGNETQVIKEFDFEMIRKVNRRSTFICSPTDGWFPMKRVEELQTEVPESDVRIVDDIPHAFCLHKSAETAELTWELIKQNVETVD